MGDPYEIDKTPANPLPEDKFKKTYSLHFMKSPDIDRLFQRATQEGEGLNKHAEAINPVAGFVDNYRPPIDIPTDTIGDGTYADGDLSAKKVVVINSSGKIVYADKDTPSHQNIVWGMTKVALADASSGDIRVSGYVENTAWTWTLGSPVFLGNNGELTQTVPTTGFLLVLGFPITATSMFLRIEKPVILA